MTNIHLTASEQKFYDKLSSDLKGGWTVEQEVLQSNDSPAKRKMRLHLMKVHDPVIKVFLESAAGAKSSEELAELLISTSLKDVHDNDLEELFFALGPDALSDFIASELQKVKTDDDLESVVALTVIRHSLLESMQPTK